jgi:hypothetical protein
MDHRQESTVALGANPDAVVKSFAPDAAPMRPEPNNMPWESVPERTLGNSLFATYTEAKNEGAAGSGLK